MTVTTDFDLRDTIRKVFSEGVGPDPKDVAAKVLEIIPIGLERDLLAYLLPAFCRQVLKEGRHQHRSASFQAIRLGNGTRSGKWALVTKAMLEDPFEVAGTWIAFGDLTADNLSWLIAARRQASVELDQEATRLANLLTLLKKQKVSTVRKLPLTLIEKVMS